LRGARFKIISNHGGITTKFKLGRIKILDAHEGGINKRVPQKYLPLVNVEKCQDF